MRNSKNQSFLKCSVLVLLIAAAAVTLPSCGNTDPKDGSETTVTQTDPQKEEITLTIAVTDPDGNVKEYDVTTESDNLEGALLDSGFVSGEESTYGLYIKTVCGITADYDTDGAYWAIYKDGEYLMTGAKDTKIAEGERYELVYTKG